MRILILLFLLLAAPVRAAEFLDPAEAFVPSARVLDARTLQVDFRIEKGYYLYRDKFRFAPAEASGVSFGEANFPAGKIKQDDNFGTVEVYAERLSVQLPLQARPAAAGPLAVEVVLQGCAEAGVCYPPQTHVLQVALPADSALRSAGATADTAAGTAVDESGRIAQTLRHSGLFTSLLFFFLAGLGLALTPCVFPMIPILSGIIVGQGQPVSRQRGFMLSLAYVLGMALTYAAAGVAAGLTGTLISAALQNPWVLGGFALMFVLLSLSMFGFYTLQLPGALQSRLSSSADHLQGGRSLGVFAMGALSALIVGPCVAAPLAGALLYIGQTGNAVLGGAALFAMAMGMGMPLLAVGLSAGALLPRAGMWMEQVKKFFGVVLLGMAIWLVSPVIPVAVQMAAWAVLLVVSAMYLHALDPLPGAASGWARFRKGCGIVMLIGGTSLLIGALSGSRDPLQPLAGLRGQPAAAPAADHLPFERIKTLAELERQIVAAGKPVMLDVYADWCTSCKELERFTFADPAVRAQLAGFKLLKADVTANDADDKAVLQRFGLFGPPGILFFDPAGKEIRHEKVVGYRPAEAFLATLKRLN
jgi:thiol:disulfide interchange protein DsbD